MARASARPDRVSIVPPEWRLSEALARYPGLALLPRAASSHAVTIAGELRVVHREPAEVTIDVSYDLTIVIPLAFPRVLPSVVENEGRIPRRFHRNPDSTLCLGSPLALHLAIEGDPTITTFIERAITPYLYSHAFYMRFGSMPHGELDHGYQGLADDVRRLFRLPPQTSAEEFLRLGGLKRRHANKQPCPCWSGRRVGRCHGAAVREARRRVGRGRCREQYSLLVQQQQIGTSRAQGHSTRRTLVSRAP